MEEQGPGEKNRVGRRSGERPLPSSGAQDNAPLTERRYKVVNMSEKIGVEIGDFGRLNRGQKGQIQRPEAGK
jgi:hypothetical protein